MLTSSSFQYRRKLDLSTRSVSTKGVKSNRDTRQAVIELSKRDSPGQGSDRESSASLQDLSRAINRLRGQLQLTPVSYQADSASAPRTAACVWLSSV
jgi:hypothetical protein